MVGYYNFPTSKEQSCDWNYEIVIIRSHLTYLKLHSIKIWKKYFRGESYGPPPWILHLCITAPERCISILFWQGKSLGQSSYICNKKYVLYIYKKVNFEK